MTDLKIFCSDCKQGFTIPEEDKEEWTCPKCYRGHAVGIGKCMPHTEDDEFSNRRKEKAPYM